MFGEQAVKCVCWFYDIDACVVFMGVKPFVRCNWCRDLSKKEWPCSCHVYCTWHEHGCFPEFPFFLVCVRGLVLLVMVWGDSEGKSVPRSASIHNHWESLNRTLSHFGMEFIYFASVLQLHHRQAWNYPILSSSLAQWSLVSSHLMIFWEIKSLAWRGVHIFQLIALFGFKIRVYDAFHRKFMLVLHLRLFIPVLIIIKRTWKH